MRRTGSSAFGGSKRVWTVVSLAFIILTHHQAAAQATTPAPAAASATTSVGPAPAAGGAPAAATPAAAAGTAATGPTAATAAAGTPAGTASSSAPNTAASRNDVSMWQAMSESLAKVMTDTLAARPGNLNVSAMVQSATEALRGVGTGQNLQNILNGTAGVGGGAAFRAAGDMAQQALRASNADLVAAFDQLRSTARNLGMALPSNSPALDTWSRMADALRTGGGRDLTAIMPALMGATGRTAGAGAANPTNMAQQAQPWDIAVTPADYRIALSTLSNLGSDAFLNGPGAVLCLLSLGLGLAASILGIVGGALFIGGASVILGAGIDSLDPSKLQKYRDTGYVEQFAELAREAEASLLPAAVNPRNIQTVDWALQVLERTINLAELQQTAQQATQGLRG